MSSTILFVDFDGVLHPFFPNPKLSDADNAFFAARHRLWRILRECPDVSVVLTTSWRDRHPLSELVRLVTADGGEDLADRFVGVTPIFQSGAHGQAGCRERECCAWIDEHEQHWPADQRPLRWLALDDFAEGFSSDCPNLLLVDGDTGLSDADVDSVIRKLQALK